MQIGPPVYTGSLNEKDHPVGTRVLMCARGEQLQLERYVLEWSPKGYVKTGEAPSGTGEVGWVSPSVVYVWETLPPKPEPVVPLSSGVMRYTAGRGIEPLEE